MRVLVLTALTVVAVIYHGSQDVAGENSHSLIGRALLRRALEAMSSKPGQINIKRRSIEENDDDETKTKEVLEDIFGSGSQEASGSSPSDVSQQSDVQNDVQSGSGSAAEQTVNNEDTETESSAQNSDEQASTTEDQQQEDAGQATDSGSASTASTTTDQASQQSEQSTVQVADKAAAPNEPIAVAKSKDEDASKKSEIEFASGEEASTREQENNDESSSSGDSDEVTSGQVAEDEHDDGSAEAIRKGMESLSRLLKPVATTLDLQVFSGSAKPKEDEDEEEEQKAVIKEEAKGESDNEEKKDDVEKDKEEKDEEEKDEEEKEGEEKHEEIQSPPKVKKCETVCKAPLTYQQCAVPRCSQKMGTIKDLCFFLCEHQKPHCRQVCKEV